MNLVEFIKKCNLLDLNESIEINDFMDVVKTEGVLTNNEDTSCVGCIFLDYKCWNVNCNSNAIFKLRIKDEKNIDAVALDIF